MLYDEYLQKCKRNYKKVGFCTYSEVRCKNFKK